MEIPFGDGIRVLSGPSGPERTASGKVRTAEYVLQKNIAGAMYWNIEADDASFTLANAVAVHLIKDYVPTKPSMDPNGILVTNP